MSRLSVGAEVNGGTADELIALLDHLRLSLDVDAVLLTRRAGNRECCVAVSAKATPFIALAGDIVPAGRPRRDRLSAAVLGPQGRRLGSLVCLRHSRAGRLQLPSRALLRAAATLLGSSPWLIPGGSDRQLDHRGGVAGLCTLLQPIVHLGSGQVIAAEALSRFAGDPAPAPADVFQLAAATQLSEPLELAAIHCALATLPGLPAGMRLYVNASPPVAASPALGELLTAAGPRRLVLELTEYDDTDPAALLSALTPLRDAGLHIAMDDLGAGYANLNRLVLLRPEIVKLDRCLTADLHRDPYRQAVVRSLVSLAGETGSRLIAEGVEGQQQADALRSLGIHYGQGYHLGIPEIPDRLFRPTGPSRPLPAKPRATPVDARSRPLNVLPLPSVVAAVPS